MELRPTGFSSFGFPTQSQWLTASVSQQTLKSESDYLQNFGAHINMSAAVYNGMYFRRERFQLGDPFLPQNATLHVDQAGVQKLVTQICTTASAFERINAANALECMINRYQLHHDQTLQAQVQEIRNSIHDPKNNPALAFSFHADPCAGGVHAKHRILKALDKHSGEENRSGKTIRKERGASHAPTIATSDNGKQKHTLQLKKWQEQTRSEQKVLRTEQRHEKSIAQKEFDALEIFTSEDFDDAMMGVDINDNTFSGR